MVHCDIPRLTTVGDEIEELAQRNLDEQTSTGCKENLELSRAWLRNCLANHTSCGPRQPEHWLPTRLLDVGFSDSSALRLVLSCSLDIETQYLALSHRWGTDMGCVLNSSNITAYQTTIPLSNISATIRDSVAVTRALGFRYLWVDSMRIVQNDLNDWAREPTTMSKVYGLSTCTIAAVNSGSGSAGYFAARNQYRIQPCRVPNPFSKDRKYSFNIGSQYLHHIHERKVRNSLWYNRGWVFQERTLSPRLLIFSQTQILWACKQLQAAETWPCGKTNENHIDRFESFMVEKSRFEKLLDRSCGVSVDQSAWWMFLKDYMASAKLTKQSDRLIAIQGIATLIQDLTGVSYFGGFWLNDNLPGSLLWKTASGNLSRSNKYCAPSWSWAAIQGTVKLDNIDPSSTISLLRVIGHETLQHNRARSSRNTQKALRVEGMLLYAAIIISCEGDHCQKAVTIEYSKTVSRPTIYIKTKPDSFKDSNANTYRLPNDLGPFNRPSVVVPVKIWSEAYFYCNRCVSHHSSNSRAHSLNTCGYWDDSSSDHWLCSLRGVRLYCQALLDLLDQGLPVLLLLYYSPNRKEGENAKYGG
jgi:hypothetical protein